MGIDLTYLGVGAVVMSIPALYFFLRNDMGREALSDELKNEEQRLSQEFNILFQMKMKNEKLGESTDFEQTKLLEIGNRLDEIRASKVQR